MNNKAVIRPRLNEIEPLRCECHDQPIAYVAYGCVSIVAFNHSAEQATALRDWLDRALAETQ